MDLQIQNRVAFITGGSSGVGRATVLRFVEEGVKVALTYHTNQAGAEETATYARQRGGEILVLQADMTDDTSIQGAVQSALEHWGRIDILINNAMHQVPFTAGGPGRFPLFEEIREEYWRPMLRGNIEGAYVAIQAVLPAMRAQGWGRIVNLSSAGAMDGRTGTAAVATAKAALHGLTASIAQQAAVSGILTNAVLPGLILTEKTEQRMPAKLLEQLRQKSPTHKLTTADDVAHLVVFLASGANAHINGELIRITGGN